MEWANTDLKYGYRQMDKERKRIKLTGSVQIYQQELISIRMIYSFFIKFRQVQTTLTLNHNSQIKLPNYLSI